MRRLAAVLLIAIVLLPGFATADTRPPAITYSIVLSGNDPLAVDPQGNAYFGLYETQLQQATPGVVYPSVVITTQVVTDSALVKIDPNGKLVFATYMLGDMQGLTFDRAGNIYTTGITTDGTNKIYVAEFDPNATKLLHLQTFGGSGGTMFPGDHPKGIALDARGFVYIIGEAYTKNFPATAGAFQTASGGSTDAFAAKLDLSKSQIVWATYLGGSGTEAVYGFGVDPAGNVYIAGTTDSPNFPVQSGALYPQNTDRSFVLKLNPAGSALVYSTYFPASINSMALDSTGAVYLTGMANGHLDVTPGAFQTTTLPSAGAVQGNQVAFVAKLAADAKSLLFSTYLGPTALTGYPDQARSQGWAIAVDSGGNPVVGGWVYSRQFPTLNPLQYGPLETGIQTSDSACFRDICPYHFLTKLDSHGEGLLWSTFLGHTAFVASGFDATEHYRTAPLSHVTQIAMDPSDNVYVASSFSLPGVYLPGVLFPPNLPNGGAQEVSLIKIEPVGPPPMVLASGFVNPADYSFIARGGLGTVFGTGLSKVDGIVAAPSMPLPTELLGVSMSSCGIPVPLLAVANVNGQQQINFQVPFGVSNSECFLIRNQRAMGYAINAQAGNSAPAVFGNYDGGTPTIVHGGDNTLVTPSNPAHPGEVIVIYATGLGAVSPPVPDGVAAPLSPLSRTTDPFLNVTIGGVDAPIQFAGLTPGYVGLYQMNVVVPQVPAGTQVLKIGFGKPATIAVQ